MPEPSNTRSVTAAVELNQHQPAYRRASFRLDIQALRAIAVAGVVLYHMWPHRLPGGFVGVDVFFVISGYLITSHLATTPPQNARMIADFWARRVKRLLPASLLVLVCTGISAFFLAPTSTWHDTGKQIIASALYVQNWVLSFDSVDYLAAENAPTAVQHFWSLSVEEQFYFIWPVVIALLCYLSRKLKLRASLLLLVGIGAVTVLSLAYSIWMSIQEPAMAYFVTPVRMWELSIGGLVAIIFKDKQPTNNLLAAVCAWSGLAGIMVSFLIISGDMAFPGYIALLPILSTCLVIASHAKSRVSPYRLMSLPPVQFVGNTSYSIYLWHWPLIVLLPTVFGNLRWWHKFGIIAVVLVLSWATMIWVENRFKRSRFFTTNTRTFLTAAVLMAVAVTGGVSVQVASNIKERASQSALERAFSDDSPCLGSRAIDSREEDPSSCPEPKKPLLDPAKAKTDKADAYADGCWARAPFTEERPICHYGDGEKRIALVGNSHAGHWLPVLQILAEENDWTIDTYLVDTCNPTDAVIALDTEEKSKGCHKYGQWAKSKTTSGDYDAVITSERQVSPIKGSDLEHTVGPAAEGYKPFLRAWDEAQTPVVVLRDTPFPARAGVNVPDCVAQQGPQADKCEGTLESWKSIDPLSVAAEQLDLPSQSIINSNDRFCPDGMCPAVIGGVIVYFDGSHMTSTYSKTLAPWLEEQLKNQNNGQLIR